MAVMQSTSETRRIKMEKLRQDIKLSWCYVEEWKKYFATPGRSRLGPVDGAGQINKYTDLLLKAKEDLAKLTKEERTDQFMAAMGINSGHSAFGDYLRRSFPYRDSILTSVETVG